MTPLEAVNELAAMSLHKDFWKPYRFLDDNTFLFNDWMREIRPLSAGLLGLFLVLEIHSLNQLRYQYWQSEDR